MIVEAAKGGVMKLRKVKVKTDALIGAPFGAFFKIAKGALVRTAAPSSASMSLGEYRCALAGGVGA